MTTDIVLVFVLLATAVALFISDRVRMDIVALMLIVALMVSGLLSPSEALAGFGDPLVILIAGLFVVGEALFRTGVALSAGNWLVGVAGNSETLLLMLLMLVVALLSAFMSNTGAVAIFIPVALNLAARAGMAPSRLLLPMAYAGSIGGMLTLIGTPPNLAVTTELTRVGLEPFGFFSFLPAGAAVLAVTMAFFLLLGRTALAGADGESAKTVDRLSLADLIEAYDIQGRAHLVRIEQGSALAGSTLGQAKLRSRFGVTVIGMLRPAGRRLVMTPALVQTEYRIGDVLLMFGSEAEVLAMTAGVSGLARLEIEEKYRHVAAREVGLAEVLLTPRSQLIGHTIREARFREDRGLSVLGILRQGKPLRDELLDARLEFGDTLLVAGGWRQIDLLQTRQYDFSVLTLPREMDEVAPYRERAPWALGIVGLMLLAMSFALLPNVAAVLIASVALVLARCVTMEEAYRAVNWQSLVLIAGMLPMATALDKSGALQLIISGFVDSLGSLGPMAMMAGLFLFTSVFSQFISNTATAVLLAPVAVGAATTVGISPYPLLMSVAVAASAAFSTPMASPVNTLVMGPGGYQFKDYARLGIPLQLLVMIIALMILPVLFPF